jgi:HlyD family secretion protein
MQIVLTLRIWECSPLEVSKAQVDLASANLNTSRTQYEKLKQAFEARPGSVSKDQVDNAENAAKAAKAGLDVAQRQLELTKNGAWVYDIQNQQHLYEALSKAYASSKALLDK